MQITTSSGTMTLDIISSAVEDENPTPSRGAGIEDYERQEHKEAQEKRFQQLCEASTEFDGDLTNDGFLTACEMWLLSHPLENPL